MTYKKYEVVINGDKTADNAIVLKADVGLSWEYPQTDGESSGATDSNVLIREVLPERDKLTLKFSGRGLTESDLRMILTVRRMDECTVNFYDLAEGKRLTKKMYPSADAINADFIFEDGEIVVEPFELRFIQMIPNG